MSISFLRVHSQEPKVKTLIVPGYKLEYPNTWKPKDFYGYKLLNPLENGRFLKRDVLIAVFPNHIKKVYNRKDILQSLEAHANVLQPHEMQKTYEIRNNPGGRFMCIIDYKLSLDSLENRYRKIEFIKLEGYSLKKFSYMAKEELFDKYYDEAMFIINSIQKRK